MSETLRVHRACRRYSAARRDPSRRAASSDARRLVLTRIDEKSAGPTPLRRSFAHRRGCKYRIPVERSEVRQPRGWGASDRGKDDAADEPVVVHCHLDGEHRFSVDIRDRGPGFDPDQFDPLPEPDDPSRLDHESGLGVCLMRTLSDEIRFERGGDGTVVSMAVEQPAQPAP